MTPDTPTRLLRPQFGTEAERSRVTEIEDHGYSRRIIRDSAGRIIGLEGRSRLDDVVDLAENLTDRVEQLEQEMPDAAEHFKPLAEQSRLIADTVRQLNQTVAQQAERVMHYIDGWRPFDAGLEINVEAVARAATRLGVQWDVTVEAMTPRDQRRMDKKLGGVTLGYRAPSRTKAHLIRLRPGCSPAETDRVLRHELGHAIQVERLLDGFDDAFLTRRAELEREADVLAARVADERLVRAADE